MKKIFAIYDVKGNCYGSLITCVNSDIAIRILDSLLRDETSDYRRYPDDFILYHLGDYCSATGSGSFVIPTPVISVKARLEYLRMLYLEQQRSECQVVDNQPDCNSEIEVDNAEA